MAAPESMLDFPDEQYVKEVCRLGQGEETCRYLAFGSEEWSCCKDTSMGRHIDERVENDDFGSRGDNCEGMLAFLCDGRLVGKEVHHRESSPSFEASGTVTELKLGTLGEEGENERVQPRLTLVAKWDGDHKFNPAMDPTFTNISVHGNAVVISATYPSGNTWTFDLSED